MQLCCPSVLTVILLLPIQQGVLYPLVAVHPRHGRGNARAAFITQTSQLRRPSQETLSLHTSLSLC